ncbi:hypothetical protein [Noviherbaspirillum galbum]|uniref:Uncharacterized protein n=1 Tax=Noviherbaspirillum galbum TaxID=2709383 RepID=A0A6B3SK71_9BURK|nr:hypothetical protein [Noviherbaspirillum galbum]NEX61130.1 hypothetical protein [Noviherbaspirillum galbum]
MTQGSAGKGRGGRQRGQAMVEYAVVCAALALALLVPVADAFSADDPRTAADLLLDAFRNAYQRFSYAISLPD